MISNSRFFYVAKYFIWSCLGVIALWMITLGFPDEASAMLVILAASGVALAIFRYFAEEKEFVTTLFLAALTARLAFGIFVHLYDLRSFFRWRRTYV